MAQAPKVINVGKQHPVYRGEAYEVNARGVVEHHEPDKNLAARKNRTVSKIVAIYSEVLNNDLTPSHRLQVMDEQDVKRAIREAKDKDKRPTERSLKYAAKAKAILKVEFHDLSSPVPPAKPLFKNRSLERIKFFIWLPIAALGGQLIAVAISDTGLVDTPGVAPTIAVVYWLGWMVYLATVFRAFGWLLDLSYEIKQKKAIKLNIPDPKSFILALSVILVGSIVDLALSGNVDVGVRIFSIVLWGIGSAMWLLLLGRFFQCVAG